MLTKSRLFAGLLSFAALIFSLAAWAQDSTLEDIKYKEDYDRVQKIVKVADIQKRCEQMVTLYKDRPDMSVALRDYVDNLFTRDLDSLMRQQNFTLIGTLSEKALKARPKFGEMYFYQGLALKNNKKVAEAMTAFARSCAIPSNQRLIQKKAKQQFDLLYRAANKGSLVGQDKFQKEALNSIK